MCTQKVKGPQVTTPFETNIYRMSKPSNVEEDPIVLRDGSRRLYEYFVTNEISAKFLQFTTAVGKAGEHLSAEQIGDCDLLEANDAIPIFSLRAKELLSATIPDEVEFHPLKTDVHGTEKIFWLCKVKKYCDVIDAATSARLRLSGGVGFDGIVYCKQFDAPFHIARDRSHPFLVVVSDAFVDLCRKRNLMIDFTRQPQSQDLERP